MVEYQPLFLAFVLSKYFVLWYKEQVLGVCIFVTYISRVQFNPMKNKEQQVATLANNELNYIYVDNLVIS